MTWNEYYISEMEKIDKDKRLLAKTFLSLLFLLILVNVLGSVI